MSTIHVTIGRIDADDLPRAIHRIEAYLPANWECVGIADEPNEFGDPIAVLKGGPAHGDGGWSATGYVIPRLASGMMFAELVDDETDNDNGSNA